MQDTLDYLFGSDPDQENRLLETLREVYVNQPQAICVVPARRSRVAVRSSAVAFAWPATQQGRLDPWASWPEPTRRPRRGARSTEVVLCQEARGQFSLGLCAREAWSGAPRSSDHLRGPQTARFTRASLATQPRNGQDRHPNKGGSQLTGANFNGELLPTAGRGPRDEVDIRTAHA